MAIESLSYSIGLREILFNIRKYLNRNLFAASIHYTKPSSLSVFPHIHAHINYNVISSTIFGERDGRIHAKKTRSATTPIPVVIASAAINTVN